MNHNELESLCQEALDGTISSENMVLLENELLQHPESLQQYLQYARLQNSLELVHEPIVPVGGASVVPIERIIRRQKRKTLRFVALATAALVLLSISILSFYETAGNEPPLAFKFAPGTDYAVTHPSDLKEKPEGLVLVKGSSLTISQGTIEFTFKSGVKSILQAPASVTLNSDDTLYMREGTAWFHVPSGAEGFTVNSSDLNIVDLGTEFGVIVKPTGADEIHVLKGKVKASTLIHRKESATLSAGQARRRDPVGRLVSIPVKASDFLTKLPTTLPYVHWSFDNIVAGKFNAEGTHPSIELAGARSPKFDIKKLRTNGPFGKAVRFNGVKGQQLHTQLPGIEGNAPRTTACWVRTSYTSKPNGTDIAGLIGWGYCLDDSKRTQSNSIWKQYIGKSGVSACHGGGVYAGKTNVTDGKWHHLACVMKPIDQGSGAIEVTLYVDGEIEDVTTYRIQPTNTLTQRSDSTPVRIGCSIHKPNTAPIVFRGAIDEVYLFYGALDQASIQNLMRNNHPTAK